MSCITKGGVRCTKCCEAIHINMRTWQRIVKRNTRGSGCEVIDQDKVFGENGVWQSISVRRAKQINPYIFQNNPEAKDMKFFTCKALIKGVGCTIRDTDRHLDVCKIYTGGDEYSPTCEEDINIIARG